MLKWWSISSIRTLVSATPTAEHREQGLVAVVDSLDFQSMADAVAGLRDTGFRRLAEYPGPWQGMELVGDFYDARPYEPGVYSKGGYWQ